MTIIKLLVFLLSQVGLWLLVRKKSGVRMAFAPVLSCCCQITVLFLAGLMNVLGHTSALLELAGLGCLLFFLIRERGAALKELLRP